MESDDSSNDEFMDSKSVIDSDEDQQNNEGDEDSSELSESSGGLIEKMDSVISSESSEGFKIPSPIKPEQECPLKPKEESQKELDEGEMADFLNQLETSSTTIKNSDAYVIYRQYQLLLGKLPNSIKFATVEDILSNPCCAEMCFMKFTTEFIMRARLRIPTSKNDKTELFQFMMIQNCTNISGNFLPKINETPICRKFFQRLYGISNHRFDSFAEQLSRGFAEPLPHGNKGNNYEQRSTCARFAKVVNYIDSIVEPNPSDSSYLLPAGTTQRHIINSSNLNTNVKINPTQEIKRIPITLRFHKTHSHKMCSICILLKEAEIDPNRSVEDQKEAGLHLRNHYANNMMDARDYEIRKIMSLEESKFLLSIGHDGMSKHLSKFPHLHKSNTKKLSDAMKMMCSLNMGVVHRKTLNTAYQLHCFWNIDQLFGSGTNSVISQLFFTISQCDPIPPLIAVQLDNCGSNKSYTLFGSFGLLLLWIPKLTNIYICTAEVGHTHNDVDAKFGILGKALKREQVYTPQGFAKFADQKLKGLSSNNLFPTTYDFDSFIKENVVQNGQIFKNHFFELSKQEDDTVTIKIARFLRSQKYLSTGAKEQPGFPLFKQPPNISDYPKEVPPKEFDTEKHKKLCQAINGSIPEEDYTELLHLPEFIKANYKPEPLKDLLDRISEKAVSQSINVNVPDDIENERMEAFLAKIKKPWDRKEPSPEMPPNVTQASRTTGKRQASTKASTKTPTSNKRKRNHFKIFCLYASYIYAVIELSNIYEIDSIKEKCVNDLERTLPDYDVKDAFKIFEVAYKYLFANDEIRNFIRENFDQLIEYDDFVNLDKSVIQAFVYYGKDIEKSEELCKAVIKWGKHQAMITVEMSEEEENDLILHYINDILPCFTLNSLIEFFVNQKGLLSINEAKKVKTIQVNIKSGEKSIIGSFVDRYGIFEYIKSHENEQLWEYDNKERILWGKIFDIPSTQSSIQKRENIQWYLLLNQHGQLCINHQSIIKENDYLIAEMKASNKNGEDREVLILKYVYATVSRKYKQIF